MAGLTNSIQASAAVNTPAVQFAQALSTLNTAKANQASYLQLISQVDQAALESNLLSLGTGTVTDITSAQSDLLASEGTLNIDNSALLLLNELEADPGNPDITGNLTAQQMQELGILIEDELALEEAANLNSPVPLTSGAIAVDFSKAAQNIAAQSDAGTINQVTPGSALTAPTFIQLEQISGILAPLANEPLTQPVLAQIQAQFAAAQLNPLLLSLSTIFQALGFVTEAKIAANVKTEDETTIAPVLSADAVAVEDSAIQA